MNPRYTGTIGIVIIGLTLVSLGYSIYNSYAQQKRMKEQDLSTQDKLNELELNLKTLLGGKYQSLNK
jgi:hypothetical protein